MTAQEHTERHKYLHNCLDELLADYARHHKEQIGSLTSLPISALMNWSSEQLTSTTELEIHNTFF